MSDVVGGGREIGDRQQSVAGGQGARLRVLVINFTMDEASPVLAWQAAVAKELHKRVGAVHVFTEWLGSLDHDVSLAIDAMPHRPYRVPRRLGAAWLMLPRLKRIIEQFRPDVCFVHMAHEWCYRIGPYLRSKGVPVLLWYAHGHVPWKLRVSTRFASRVVTSTPEGFRIETAKKRVIGQAIDTEMFSVPLRTEAATDVVTVGRVSRRKRVHLIVAAMAHVVRCADLPESRLLIVGPVLTADDKHYRDEIERLITALGLAQRVELVGAMKQSETATLYRTAALHVNVSDTGSMDKTVLEALACGCPVLTSNVAFRDELAMFPAMWLKDATPQALGTRITEWLTGMHAVAPQRLRERIVGRHDLDGFADRIVRELVELVGAARRTTGAGL